MKRMKSARRRSSHGNRWLLPLLFKFLGFIALIIGLIATMMRLMTSGMESLSVFELTPIISYPAFTPLSLFFLLNLLIISIFLLANLRSKTLRHEEESINGDYAERRQAQFPEGKVKFHSLPEAQRSDTFLSMVLELPDAQPLSERSHHGWRKIEDFSLDSTRSDHQQHESQELSSDPAHQQQQKSQQSSTNGARSGKKQNKIEGFAFDPSVGKRANHYDDARESLQIDEQISSTAAGTEGRSPALRQDDLKPVSKAISEENGPVRRANENQAAAYFTEMLEKQKSSELGLLTPDQERPLASTHFTHKKATNRSHTSKDSLKTTRPSVGKGDSLDATWKAICDGKSTHSSSSSFRHHVARHSRKAECHNDVAGRDEVTCKSKESHLSCLSPSKQRHRLRSRRQLSIPRDELNVRVESFIAKFNQQIKIQREESLLSYKKMIDRGAE